MQSAVLHIRIPSSVRDDFSQTKVLHRLMEEAMAKREYFSSQERFFSDKYATTFPKFASRVNKLKKENFGWWDDLMEWEACRLAAKEWNRKYRDLLRCWKSSKR